MQSAHYHYHITSRSGGVRQMDAVPYTSRAAARAAIRGTFKGSERPHIKKVDARYTCKGECPAKELR